MENPQTGKSVTAAKIAACAGWEPAGTPHPPPPAAPGCSRSECRRGGGIREPSNPGTAPQRHKALPPTIPAGSSWVSRAPALRVLPSFFPQAVFLLLKRRLSPSLLPERSGQMRSLGEKKCERSHDSRFLSLRHRSRARSFLSRAPARAAPLSPRASFSAAPASALSSHYSRVAGGQEVIRDRPVAASTRKARCRRGGRARSRGEGRATRGLGGVQPEPQTRGRGEGGGRRGRGGGICRREDAPKAHGVGALGPGLGGSVRVWGWG